MDNTVSFPLGAPVYQNNKLTVDTALKQPGRITKRLSDLTLQRFIVDKIFGSSGTSAQAGAIVYDQLLQNELYLSRDIEARAPGDEYPIIFGERSEPKVAKSEDFGGKFFVTDEARDRNDATGFNQNVTQLGNTLVRKVNTRAVETLEAAITAVPDGAGVVIGNDWSAVEITGTSPTPTSQRPVSDFANVQLAAEIDELGIQYDLWIMNPVQKAALVAIYGGDLQGVLDSSGIEIFTSNRVTAGTAYAVARGQVGFLDYEHGLNTRTWRDEGTRRTWVQSFVMPIMGVTNPYAVRKVTGLG